MEHKTLTLERLLKGLPVLETRGDLLTPIKGIACDSRQVGQESMFAAVPGTAMDGHDFIPAAIKAGASGLLVSTITPECSQARAVARVKDVRTCMGQIAGRLHGHPDHEIKVIAITGTNGKTTITYILESILTSAGAKPGVTGTINYRINDKIHPATNTTPESLDLLKLLTEMKQNGATHMIAEVSSHALHQHRVAGICVDAAVFTNLSRDHLDYHQDMDNYFQAKQLLFNEVLTGQWELDRPAGRAVGPAVINIDDPYGERLAKEAKGPVITFGMENKQARIRAANIQLGIKGTRFKLIGLKTDLFIETSLPGRHNVSNLLAAIALAWAIKIPPAIIQGGIKNLVMVPGRLEAIPNTQNLTVLVDYAHTPDALDHAIHTCRELVKGSLIVLFGAGGDRDRGKRPLMGEIAAKNADKTIITSDNPRTEDPMDIIKEIIPGVKKTGALLLSDLNQKENGYLVEPDRRQAIEIAIAAARPEDIVLITGKGHEDYQIVGTTKHHFDDRQIASEIMANL